MGQKGHSNSSLFYFKKNAEKQENINKILMLPKEYLKL